MKNSILKKLIIPSSILMLVFAIIFGINVYLKNSTNKKIINSKLENMVTIIKKNYPNVSEEDIIRSTQDMQEVNTLNSNNLFEKYGYSKDDYYDKKIESNQSKYEKNGIIIFITMWLALLILYFIYYKKQNQKIDELSSYLKELNQKKYALKIEENNEDELSKLRNELYKTTILLKETAENSREENIRLSNSLADISHQIKTPITSIRIMLDNIEENPNMDDSTKSDFIKEISNQVEWISELVISLLKLAKFDSGTIVMNSRVIEGKKLVNDAINNLSVLLDLKDIKIEIASDDNTEFDADYKWQLEAITNILKNCIEHSKEKSIIHIKIENSSVFLKIIITDEGEGISSKDLKHIFERFYKSSNSSENSIGIGLSLSKAIIERDNGFITVSSKVGEGTSFNIKYLK